MKFSTPNFAQNPMNAVILLGPVDPSQPKPRRAPPCSRLLLLQLPRDRPHQLPGASYLRLLRKRMAVPRDHWWGAGGDV
jgi:hypothetical protein